MKATLRHSGALAFALCAFLIGPACSKKPIAATTPVPPAPSMPAASAPTVNMSVSPARVERGQAATLSWSSANAVQATIDQSIGEVSPSGQRQVFPSQTTTYTIQVRGAGGQANASTTLNVTVQVADNPTPQQIQESLVEAVNRLMRDAHFDYDKYEIRSDARQTLNENAQTLNSLLARFSGYEIVIEGHADERGSSEYNLALGDRRAVATRDFLTGLGVPERQLQVISYGKEQPACTAQTEDCWQINRRAHFTARPISQ